ncbi:hypothetical protein BZZ01_09685 [Nostocales cyanobacterium HT-58-2]|nr:hypothetical protein BZZ01_09685 [Nostocales cyanobacterium HT-58-2]
MSQQTKEDTTQFWQQFILKNWEYEPLAIQKDFTQAPTTSDELFSIILDNSPNEPCPSKGLYIDGKLHTLAGTHFCPTKEDGSFSGYDKRIRSLISEQEYALVVGNIEVNKFLWESTYVFLKQLHSALGYLYNGHFHTILYGNYNSLPFGVYCNPYPPEGKFYFPIVTEENVVLWKPEYVEKNPSIVLSKKYDEFLQDSLTLKAKPGGMIYWPSNRWYTTTSQAGSISLVMVMNVSNNFAVPLAKFLIKEIDYLYGNSLKGSFLKKIIEIPLLISIVGKTKLHYLGYSWKNSLRAHLLKNISNSDFFVLIKQRSEENQAFFNPKNIQESAENIPDALKLAAIPFKEIFDSSIVERATIKLWLRMLTCYGYTPFPKAQNTLFQGDKELTINNYVEIWSSEHPILWRQRGENELIVCVKGHFIQVLYHPIFVPLIKNINTGKVYSIKKLLEHSIYMIKKSEDIEFIEKLVLKFLNELLSNCGIKVIDQSFE